MANAFEEVGRVGRELRDVCGVGPPAGGELRRDVVDGFVDPKLQHNNHQKAKLGSNPQEGERECKWARWTSDAMNERERGEEEKLYGQAMQVYCDVDSGFVFKDVWEYKWPL